MIYILDERFEGGYWHYDSTFLMKGFKGESATWFYFLDEMFMGGICNMILLFRWNVYGGIFKIIFNKRFYGGNCQHDI